MKPSKSLNEFGIEAVLMQLSQSLVGIRVYRFINSGILDYCNLLKN